MRDPDVSAVMTVAAERRLNVVVSADRLFMLKQLLLATRDLPGEVWECGVYQGLTASLLHRLKGTSVLRLFDTFTGLPAGDPTKGDTHKAGDFSDTSVEKVTEMIMLASTSDISHYFIHTGLIPDTFSGLEDSQIRFAHVDVDLYHPVRACCEFIYPRLVTGGIMVFDDYSFETTAGARRAINEWSQEQDVFNIHMPFTGQSFIIKSERRHPMT
jgi:O-methyltransferase